MEFLTNEINVSFGLLNLISGTDNENLMQWNVMKNHLKLVIKFIFITIINTDN